MRLLTQRFALLWLVGVSFLPGLRAQVLEAPVKGFQYGEFDQTTGKRKFLLTGASATNVSTVELALAGARLEIYDEEGKTNLIVMSPQCRYHNRNKIIYSADKLEVFTGDDQVSIEGEGFEWRQADTRLAISNRVHAVIRKDLVGAEPALRPSAASTVAQPPPQTNLAANPTQLIHIYSDRFQSQTTNAAFQGNVRVEEAQGKLTCGLLTATFSEPDRKIATILAEQDVVIDSGEVHATGEQATYRIANDVVELKENPTWRIGQRQGRAQEVVFHRKTKAFHASGDVQVKLPAGSVRQGSFLLLEGNGTTNRASAKDQPVEVLADDFQFKADTVQSNMNVAVFTGNVRVNDERGKLRCESMTIRSAAGSGRTERLVAERNVVIEQGDNRLTGAKAVYSSAAEAIEVSGSPTWKLGDREGRADLLVFDVKRRAYRASRNVQMRLPPGAFGRSAWLLPKAAKPTETPAATAEAKEPARAIEISSDDFVFEPASVDVKTDLAVYRGNVRVSDPGRMALSCEALTGRIAAGTNQMQSVIAENKVEIRVVEPKGGEVARGDRVVYTAGRDEVVLTAADGVEIILTGASGESRARGQTAVYVGSDDLFELIGNPGVITPKGEVTGDRVVFDRGKSTAKATGYWKMKLRPEGFETPAPPAKGK